MGNGIEITMLGGFRVVIYGRVVPAEPGATGAEQGLASARRPTPDARLGRT